MAGGPGVSVDIELSPIVAVDDADGLAAVAALPVWLPSPWPVSCGVPFFGVTGADSARSVWLARTCDPRAFRSLLIAGLCLDRRPSSPWARRRIDRFAGEGAMRKVTDLRDGVEIVTYNLTVLLADMKLTLSGRGMSADELTGIVLSATSKLTRHPLSAAVVAVAIAVVGAIALGATHIFERPLDCTTDDRLTASYQHGVAIRARPTPRRRFPTRRNINVY